MQLLQSPFRRSAKLPEVTIPDVPQQRVQSPDELLSPLSTSSHRSGAGRSWTMPSPTQTESEPPTSVRKSRSRTRDEAPQKHKQKQKQKEGEEAEAEPRTSMSRFRLPRSLSRGRLNSKSSSSHASPMPSPLASPMPSQRSPLLPSRSPSYVDLHSQTAIVATSSTPSPDPQKQHQQLLPSASLLGLTTGSPIVAESAWDLHREQLEDYSGLDAHDTSLSREASFRTAPSAHSHSHILSFPESVSASSSAAAVDTMLFPRKEGASPFVGKRSSSINTGLDVMALGAAINSSSNSSSSCIGDVSQATSRTTLRSDEEASEEDHAPLAKLIDSKQATNAGTVVEPNKAANSRSTITTTATAAATTTTPAKRARRMSIKRIGSFFGRSPSQATEPVPDVPPLPTRSQSSSTTTTASMSLSLSGGSGSASERSNSPPATPRTVGGHGNGMHPVSMPQTSSLLTLLPLLGQSDAEKESMLLSPSTLSPPSNLLQLPLASTVLPAATAADVRPAQEVRPVRKDDASTRSWIYAD